ncbi:WD repeat-containing protein 75-like [Babylonia areolata]|uniref:WD repeat-containing protein 75-like n=1 Tax=Babylonia areolata TaxID=304850 RepID=UPI003FD484E1
MAEKDGHEGSSVVLSLCSGASTNGQIAFSHDSRYFSCCSGWMVKVYNTTNGQCAQVLDGHHDVVTGLALNPANKLQLFSCGLDGLINQWIYADGVLLRTYSFYMPLHALVSVHTSAAFVTAIAHRPQATGCCVLRLPLKKDRKSAKPAEGATEVAVKADVLLPVCKSDHRCVSYGCNEQCIAAVQGHELSVYWCSRKSLRKHTTEASNPFTCVACHPTEFCLATGHTNGSITFWWNFFNKEKTVMSTSHWHSLPVQCLAFSPEGSCLLSGGHECVLVRWQMNSEHKDFLPRLGAPLHSVTPSPDGALYVTGHTDNVLQLITSSLSIVHAMRGLARAHLGSSATRPTPVGLLVDPRSRALVTNGRPGHLQFYNIEADCQLYNLDIVGHNYVSPDNLQKPPTVTEVEQAAFDPNGDWLATFQRWEDGASTPEYCLKFWRYNKKQQNYQLNTTVEMPHYKAVRCLRFKPGKSSQSGSPVLVSAGDDGLFKLWSLVTETHHGKPVRQWTCQWVGHYRSHPASIARFSSDGTTLAVVFDTVLTLWDPERNVLLDKLLLDHTIRCMEFGVGSCAHFIAVSTTSHLMVLDLKSLSVHLQVAMPDALLATDGELLCAVSGQQDLYVFRLGEDRPLLCLKQALKNPVVAAAFLPRAAARVGEEEDGEVSWQTRSRLYLLDSQQALFTPTLAGHKARTPRSRAQVQLKQVLPQTPFQALLKSSRGQGEEKEEEDKEEGGGPTGGAGDHRAVRPLAGLDVMTDWLSMEDSFSKKAQRLLDTMMLRKKGQAEPMDVDQEHGREEDVAMVTDSS